VRIIVHNAVDRYHHPLLEINQSSEDYYYKTEAFASTQHESSRVGSAAEENPDQTGE